MRSANSPSLGLAFRALLLRDLRLAWSQGGTGTMVLSFFVMAVSLFPFGVGPQPGILERIAPGILLVVAMLATLISLDRLFQNDYEDGTLEQLSLSPLGLTGVVVAKCLAHSLSTLLPLVVTAPIAGLMLNLPVAAWGVLVITLLMAAPALSMIGAIGASLTVALRRGGVLLSLLVLPLYIPTLIFAAGAVDAAVSGFDVLPHLALLGAVSLVALLVAIPAAVGALKMALE